MLWIIHSKDVPYTTDYHWKLNMSLPTLSSFPKYSLGPISFLVEFQIGCCWYNRIYVWEKQMPGMWVCSKNSCMSCIELPELCFSHLQWYWIAELKAKSGVQTEQISQKDSKARGDWIWRVAHTSVQQIEWWVDLVWKWLRQRGLEIMVVHDYSVKISISFDWISIRPFAFELWRPKCIWKS